MYLPNTQHVLVSADDSKYKGFKPDEAKTVADALRKALADAVGKNLTIVDKPGPHLSGIHQILPR